MPDFTNISYPNAANVPGGGGFFAWGTMTPGATFVSATLYDAAAGGHVVSTGANVAPPIPSGATPPTVWAARFDSVPVNINVWLEAVSAKAGVSTPSARFAFKCVI
jgi:hypothetical protein